MAVRVGRERRDLRAFELVLAARGIDSRIEFQDGEWRLTVAEDDLDASRRELAAYEGENAPTPAMPQPARIDGGWWGVAGYLMVIWATLALEASAAFGWDWRAAGRLHVAAVRDGELWRLVTALTLHADLGHIVANSVFGGLFGALAGRYLGTGLAWLVIVAGGALGNGVNVLVRPAAFLSIGASTATFAALGAVSAFLWRSGYFRQLKWQRAFAPVFAAIALFAYTGVGDESTDLVAHAAGLAAGFGLGLWVAKARLQLIDRRMQWFCGAAAAAGVVAAWLLAG